MSASKRAGRRRCSGRGAKNGSQDWRGTFVRRPAFSSCHTRSGRTTVTTQNDNSNEEIQAKGSTTDKIKGLANEATGNVKQAAGRATDKPSLEVEGKLQEHKGETQQAVGKTKDAVKKTVDKA